MQEEELQQRKAHLPFCSERCRLLDLGKWADGSYRIPSAADQEKIGKTADESPQSGDNEEEQND